MSKFNQYASFVAVVNTGSIRLAAQSLNRTPSALSKQITNLEHDIGVQLFDRSNKQLALTHQGKRFYKTCSAVIRQVKESEDQLRADNTEIAGRISITLSRSLIGSPLVSYLNAFSARHKDIQYRIHYSEDIDSFDRSDIDFAFRIGELPDSTRLVARELTEVQPTFFATPEYLAKFGHPNSFLQLASHRIAMPPLEDLSAEVRRWLKTNCAGVATQGTCHIVDDVNAITDMALGHGCIGFNLNQSLTQLIESGAVIPLFQDTKLPSKKLHLLYRKPRYDASHLNAFKHFITEKYA